MTWNATWESIFQTRPWGKYPGEDLVRFVARNFYGVEDRGKVKILEVGSGTGANLWFLAREGFPVYAVEGSATGIALTKQRLNEEVPGWQGELVQGSIESIDFPDNTFDAVIDIEALSCNDFENSQAIYQEIHRVLKPNGLLYSRTFADDCAGANSGDEVSYHMYLPKKGPLAGIGPVRLTHAGDIPDLLVGYELLDQDMSIPSMKPEQRIREWKITARKH